MTALTSHGLLCKYCAFTRIPQLRDARAIYHVHTIAPIRSKLCQGFGELKLVVSTRASFGPPTDSDMPLQTQRLRMYARGVSDDPPSDGIREKLVDGIHLRWFFESSLGFPRYGFHLFRRPSGLASAETRCLATELSSLLAGLWPAAFLDTGPRRLPQDVN